MPFEFLLAGLEAELFASKPPSEACARNLVIARHAIFCARFDGLFPFI